MKRPGSEDCSSVSVLIPALNEEASLPLVLRDLPSEQVSDILVVDNGSHDHTAEVARAGGARVVQEPRRGYGAACLRGLADFASRPEGPPDIVVFLDADYSDHPEELPYLVQPILENRFDLVIGSRLTGRREPGAMPPQSVWGNRLACFLMWLLFRARYTDLGPCRAIRWTALEQLGMVDQNYGVFLTLAWGWLLSSAQNPWYFLWGLPFIVFDGRRCWFLLLGFPFLYYLRFLLEYQAPATGVGLQAARAAFDFQVVWLEYLPFFLALVVETWRLRRAKAHVEATSLSFAVVDKVEEGKGPA